MLEILLLVYLGKQLGQTLRAKGRSAGWFQVLLVVLWIGGELAGAVTVMLLTADGSGEVNAAAYVGALVGAACGAAVVFIIARSLPPVEHMRTGAFPVIPVTPSGPYSPPPPPPPL